VLDIKQTNLKDVADTALTEPEKSQGAEFWLEASALSAEELAARQSDVDLLNTAASVRDAENQLFFDISLYKKIGSAEKEKITSKLSTKAKFTIAVPEAYKAPSDVTRTFYLLRCHDGEATVAGQSTSMTISAEADGFSTFALAYNDTAKSTSTNKTTTPTTTTTTTRTTTPTTSTTTRSTTPATGDDSMPVAIIGAAAALGVAAVGFGVYTKRKNS
jgi:LPXTG-motif cell wall-anchored protein